MRRPLAVLILVLGAIASLLFALDALFGGERAAGTSVNPGYVVKPTQEPAESAPLEAPLAVAENLEESSTRVVAGPEPGTDRGALTGQIRGFVEDELGAPVAEATVSLVRGRIPRGPLGSIGNRRPPKMFAEVTTGPDGTFRFDGLQPDKKWSIKVTHASYNAGVINGIDVPAEGGIDERVTLRQGMTMRGRVTDATSGRPIPGAKLLIESPAAMWQSWAQEPVAEVETDEFGAYELRNLPSDPHTLRILASGYATQFLPNFVNDLRSRTPEVEKPAIWQTNRGAQMAELAAEKRRLELEPVEWDFELEVGQIIAGRVLGPDRGGISGVKVTAINQSGNAGSRGSGFSDADGEFVVADLGEGVYTLQTEAEGYEGSPLQRIEVGRTDVEILLSRQGGVSGRVVDAETGRAVTGFTVKVRTLHPNNVSWGAEVAKKVERDRSDGVFKIEGISEGDYVIEGHARGYASSFSEPFHVDQGILTTDIKVALTKGGTLRGIVLDSYSGEPIVGATVTTYDNNFIDSEMMNFLNSLSSSATSKLNTKTDAKGEFVVELLTPDVYQVRIEKTSYTGIVLNDLRVEDGVDTDLGTQVMLKGATISGVVYDEDKNPVANAQVTMQPSTNDYFGGPPPTRTDANGRYVIRNIRGGEYALSAQRPTENTGANPFSPVIDMNHSKIDVEVVDGGVYDNLDLEVPRRTAR